MILTKRHVIVGTLALLLMGSVYGGGTASENIFREEAPHETGPTHHASTTQEAAEAQLDDGLHKGHYLFFHQKQQHLRQGTQSSTSSSTKGKTDTTSDSKPSSTNDSSFPGESQEEAGSSTSSSTKGKTNTSSDSKPSSTNDSSWKGTPQQSGGDSEDQQDKSSGSSTGPDASDNTSDSKPSSTNDSSMNSDGQGDEEQSEETESSDETTQKSDVCKVSTTGNFGTTSTGGRGLQFFYQMETPGAVSETVVNDILLPLVEIGIAGSLLSLLFADCRNETKVSLRRRSLFRGLQGSNNTCEAKGFSNLPVDRVLSGGTSIALFS